MRVRPRRFRIGLRSPAAHESQPNASWLPIPRTCLAGGSSIRPGSVRRDWWSWRDCRHGHWSPLNR